MAKILELGCGNKKGCGCPYEGEITGVDVDKDSQADVIWNLEKFPYPFKDNEFDAVYTHHCVEHLADTIAVMNELHRITKAKGRVTILVPYGSSAWSLSNVTHKKFFNADSIKFFTAGNSNSMKTPPFRLLRVRYNYIYSGFPELQSWKGKLFRKVMKPMDWLINWNHAFYDKILRHYVGDADEIEWELSVIKED